ncbi:hypothetical protein CEXT_665051 [Caerostris extrusa]|uniref:Uncharacterized protein n=1 Tax=Caerostris extrusa TaxID=172846 RepID=A0AAV4RKN5_CAEEX|nr:hypothetical protein CEXT_665051 [Caerostris extrusa]
MKDSQLSELGRICAKSLLVNLEAKGGFWRVKQGEGVEKGRKGVFESNHAMDVNEAGCWLEPIVAPLNSRYLTTFPSQKL